MIWGTSALFHEFAHLCGTGCPGSGTSALQPLSLRRGCLGALGVNFPLPGPFDGWAWGCGFGGVWKVETPLVAPVAPSACRSLCVPFCSWPSTGWWVGSSSPGNEPEEGPEGNVGALALAGQVKYQSVFVPVHKPFKTPKVSISIVYLQPHVLSAPLCVWIAQGGLWVWLLGPADQALGRGCYKVCRAPASSRWAFSEMLSFHLDSWPVKAKGGRLGSCVAFLGRAR